MINFDADWEHHIDQQVEGPDPDEDTDKEERDEVDEAIEALCRVWKRDIENEPKARQGEIIK